MHPTPPSADTLSASVRADGSLDADSIEACPSIVCPSRRLSYEDVDSMLLECTPEQEPDIFKLHEVRVWQGVGGGVAGSSM